MSVMPTPPTQQTPDRAHPPAEVRAPEVSLCRPFATRARLAARWVRFGLRSIASRDLDFAFNALRAELALAGLILGDILKPSRRHACNVCGWQGRRFYPNVGPGYDERDTICPGCGVLDRHRGLAALLETELAFLSRPCTAMEVAPFRGLQRFYLTHPSLNYRSFDITRFAMEQGDIRDMKYDDESFDVFIAFHVLEHIVEEDRALGEIRRVLKPGGTLVAQVPVDWSVGETYEYEKPDPREVGHVRRYGRDVGDRWRSRGFEVRAVRPADVFDPRTIDRFGFDPQPVYFCRKPTPGARHPEAGS